MMMKIYEENASEFSDRSRIGAWHLFKHTRVPREMYQNAVLLVSAAGPEFPAFELATLHGPQSCLKHTWVGRRSGA